MDTSFSANIIPLLPKLIIGSSKAWIYGKDLLGGFPSGIITMWSGTVSNIPDGWYLCDGSNGTPNLRDRFIVGAGSTYSPGNTGGSATVALTIAQMPSHTHTASVSLSGLTAASAGRHTHSLYLQGGSDRGSQSQPQSGNNGGGYGWSNDAIEYSGAHTHTITGSASCAIGATGSGSSHENRPPYYALCFIMKA